MSGLSIKKMTNDGRKCCVLSLSSACRERIKVTKNECNAKRKDFSFHFHNIAYFTACYSLNGDAK